MSGQQDLIEKRTPPPPSPGSKRHGFKLRQTLAKTACDLTHEAEGGSGGGVHPGGRGAHSSMDRVQSPGRTAGVTGTIKQTLVECLLFTKHSASTCGLALVYGSTSLGCRVQAAPTECTVVGNRAPHGRRGGRLSHCLRPPLFPAQGGAPEGTCLLRHTELQAATGRWPSPTYR